MTDSDKMSVDNEKSISEFQSIDSSEEITDITSPSIEVFSLDEDVKMCLCLNNFIIIGKFYTLNDFND